METYHDVSCMRINLMECDHPPSFLLGPYLPDEKTFSKRAWIPQSMGDQVWMLFKFHSMDIREAWERSLPRDIARWLDRDLIPFAVMTFGWKVRDFNGFVIKSYEGGDGRGD